MVAKAKKEQGGEIQVLKINTQTVHFCVLGVTPIILNSVSAKVRQELLMPRGRKTAADKASNLKHEPLEEYRNSPYLSKEDNGPTRLLLPATMFKAALRSVALDMPGVQKTEIGRLTYVEGTYIDLYGVPQMLMSVTRCADANKTPDIRTRAIVPKWACQIAVTFVRPLLREQTVMDLMAAAGVMRGVGDWRPEKGAGSYGQFELVGADDPRYKAITKRGRAEQEAALRSPEYYDVETENLYTWFVEESERRGFRESKKTSALLVAPELVVAAAKDPAAPRRRRTNGRTAT